MMSAFDERRQQDVQKLRDLERLSRGRIKVTRVAGSPPSEIEAELHLNTAPSEEYPRRTQATTHVNISLPARYPFVEPTVNIQTPIFHPNVYSSGRICLGLKWLPSFGLDLLVRRVAQIITFDPAVLNVQSPANGGAATWYRQSLRTHPHAFPTDSLDLSAPTQAKSMSWTDAASSSPPKVIVGCPHCATKLSLPPGRSGSVKCPKCSHSFPVST